MGVRRPVVFKRSSCLSWSEAIRLTALGGVVLPYFRDRDGRLEPVLVPDEILCWWCRDRHAPGEVVTCMAIPRPQAVSNGDSTSCSIVKMPSWLSQLPEIWEFLSLASYKDGAPRQLGKVSLGLVSGGVQMTLTDPSSSTYCSRQFPSLDDALLSFELGLKDGSLTWRASGPPKGRKRP